MTASYFRVWTVGRSGDTEASTSLGTVSVKRRFRSRGVTLKAKSDI